MHFSMYYGTDYLVFASKFILSGAVQTYPFSLKTQKFFFLRFSKIVFPHVEFLCRFCPSRCVRFRLKAQKLFPFLIISPSTRGVFDTVTSSFSKSSVFKSLHENTKTALSHVRYHTFHFCIILRYFDQGCLSFVII